MKEYGSNIQKIVGHIVALPDREKRTKHAHILIELMRQIHPQMRQGVDYSKKLWDDLYVMGDFELDVDSPFPPPPKEIMGRKPIKMPYTQKHLRFRFYGKNIELLIKKAIETPSFDERKAFVSYMVRLMQGFFLNWNKDTITVNSCLGQILEISENKLKPEVDWIKANGLIEGANPKDKNKGASRQPSFKASDTTGKQFRRNKNNRNPRYSKSKKNARRRN